MSLNRKTVTKILNELFIGQTPIVFKGDEQKEFISKIKKELDTIDLVSVRPQPHYSSSKEHDRDKICSFSIDDTSLTYSYGDFFSLKFNEKGELLLEYENATWFVYNIEMLWSFINKMKSEYERKKAVKTKREKINKLKQHAIVAKIKEIAKEDEFDFAVREYDNKLKLFVRAQKTVAELDIPFHKFQEILTVLRSFVGAIKELNKVGIDFKISTRASGGFLTWIKYEDL